MATVLGDVETAAVGFVTGAWVPDVQQLYLNERIRVFNHFWVGRVGGVIHGIYIFIRGIFFISRFSPGQVWLQAVTSCAQDGDGGGRKGGGGELGDKVTALEKINPDE